MTEVGSYREPAREVPILGEFDVLVVGGGPAGCSAALYAARHGANVLLVEKDGYLGGATVSQLSVNINSTNGVDFQGVWHEFMHVMQRLGGVRPIARRKEYEIHGNLDPEVVKRAWDLLLSEARVSLLHHAYAAGAIVEDGAINGILVETKAGRAALMARRVIDCTGDGVVCAAAGVPWEQGDGLYQWAMSCTTLFRLGNVHKPEGFPTEEHLRKMEQGLREALEHAEYTTPIITSGRVLAVAKEWFSPLPAYRPELRPNTSRVLQVNPLDPWDITRAEREGREQAWQVAEFYRKYVPGCDRSYLLDTAAHIGVRSSRRACGLATLTDQDVIEFHKYRDSIARGSWHIDLWPANSYTKDPTPVEDPEYRKRITRMKAGDYYDIRYGCIVARGVENLLVAGRCISAEHVAQASARLQQTCMSTGQAAGTAAALSLRLGTPLQDLDPSLVVNQLRTDRASVAPAFDLLKDLPSLE